MHYESDAMDRMITLFQKSHKGWKSIPLVWNGHDSGEDVYTAMVPPDFKHGDPIYFNLDNFCLEYK